MEILTKKDNKEIIKAPVCPRCGEPMLWFQFCLPYCDYVCVPCGGGVGMMNAGEEREYPAEEIKALREKYAADLHKRSYETAKAGGGKCSHCGRDFNCKSCKEAEAHEYQYWGKTMSNNQACFCSACTKENCKMKRKGNLKMEKFKRFLMFALAFILPPLMLVLFILGITFIISLGFNTIEENNPNFKQSVQTIDNAFTKVWNEFGNWANEKQN